MSAAEAARFLPDGGLPPVLARALFDAALLSVCGSLVFRALVWPRVKLAPARAAPVEQALARLTRISLLLALLGLVVWTVKEAAAMSGAEGLSSRVAALWPVLAHTRFGHLVLLQLALLAATGALLHISRPAAIAATANVAAQAGHGHAMAMHGAFSLLFGMDVLHLAAAAVWIGGLAPLLLVVRLAPAAAGARAARWFTPVGKWAVGLLAGSALVQGRVLVGSLGALWTMPYGVVVLVKAGLFGVLLGFALLNRYRLAPDLLGHGAERARRRLAASIVVQTALGLLAVAAAATLSGLAPGVDMQPGRS